MQLWLLKLLSHAIPRQHQNKITTRAYAFKVLIRAYTEQEARDIAGEAFGEADPTWCLEDRVACEQLEKFGKTGVVIVDRGT